MSLFLILTLILIVVFLVNYCLYWTIYLKTNLTKRNFWEIYEKIYIILWAIPIVSIPIVSSGFFTEFNNQISYFQQLWIWFLVLGIIFLVIAFKMERMFRNNREYATDEKVTINIKGIFEIMRHPKLVFWALIFLALAFIFDSFFALIFAPFFILFLQIQAFLEEKYIFFPKYGKQRMDKYIKKTPSKLFPWPYNMLLIIITILVFYIGLFVTRYYEIISF